MTAKFAQYAASSKPKTVLAAACAVRLYHFKKPGANASAALTKKTVVKTRQQTKQKWAELFIIKA